jgi:hypothetical protein
MNVPFNGPKLMEKAKEIAKNLDVTEFSGSKILTRLTIIPLSVLGAIP